MTTTFDRLRAILVRDYKLDPATVTPEVPLESLGIDSLGVAELLFTIEDAFGIKLPNEPVMLPTVDDVVRYIDELAAAQADAQGAAHADADMDAAAEPAAAPPGPESSAR